MQKLMNAVGEMSVTFHRAFDMCSNPKEALEQIIGLGIDRVLTSGQEATAEKGIPLLKDWWNRPTDGSSSCRDAV